MGRMQGKVALISGAAAARDGQLMGFGGASAHAFAREGARVVLTDIRDDLGTASVEAMRARGYDARYRRLDVTVEADWRDAVAFTLAEFGELNVLVNNAGAVARVDIDPGITIA